MHASVRRLPSMARGHAPTRGVVPRRRRLEGGRLEGDRLAPRHLDTQLDGGSVAERDGAGFARRESAERATEETFILPCRGGSLSDAGVVASPTGCGTGMRTMCVLLSKRLRTEGPVEIEVGVRLRAECRS